ncbi:MAG: hypothetical protein POH28_04090, partial [Acidocella sp.]|nr:hypothetical protein [Acidocella sp.]
MVGRCRVVFRVVIGLAAALLSACAMGADGGQQNAAGMSAYGPYLAARYAQGQGDPVAASRFYAQALRLDPHDPVLATPGFMAALQAGDDAEADRLAGDVAGNGLAQLVRADQALLAGDDGRAASLFAA